MSGGALMAKSEFARHCGVHPSRVSQWIRAGQIPPSALEGEGQRAKIRVEPAIAALKARLDVSQRFGNGLTTRLEAPAAQGAAAAGGAPASHDDLDARIKAEKLREVEMRNQDRERERAIAAGRYVPVEHHKGAVARLARVILDALEHETPELAQRLAAALGADARTVRHELTAGMREVRRTVADRLEAGAARLPDRVDDPGAAGEGEDGGEDDAGEAAARGPSGRDGGGERLGALTAAAGVA